MPYIKLTKCKQCPHMIPRRNGFIDYYECHYIGRPVNPEVKNANCNLDSFEIARIEEYLNRGIK